LAKKLNINPREVLSVDWKRQKAKAGMNATAPPHLVTRCFTGDKGEGRRQTKKAQPQK
jgi:hypothetical protein